MTSTRLAVALLIAAAAALSAAAQGTPAERSAREKQIIAAEHKLIDAVAKGDVGAFKSLVEADAWSVSPRGAMPVAEFMAGMKDLKLEPGWTISDARVVWAAGNTAVLFYKLTGKATFMGQPLPPVVYSSTVWHESNRKWTASFHQGNASRAGEVIAARMPSTVPARIAFPMRLEPGARLGPYAIQSPLGAGGMGEVYKARDTRLDRDVAIKILPGDATADLTERAFTQAGPGRT